MTFVVSSKDEKPEGRSCYRCLHTGADMLSVYPWRPATESWTATGPGSRVDPRGGGTLHTVWSQMKCWMLILLDALILHQSPINTYRKIKAGPLWDQQTILCSSWPLCVMAPSIKPRRGGRFRRRGLIYGWFVLMYNRNQHNIIKQLSFS